MSQETASDVKIENGFQAPPLELTGALEKFSYEDTTPTIGREFFDVNIVNDLLNGSNSDALIRDLAITSKLLPTSA